MMNDAPTSRLPPPPGARFRVLILGGYGTFGGRLARLLADDPRLVVIVAGRSRRKAERFCRHLPHAAAMLTPAQIDRDGDLSDALAKLRPDLVVDASGPFQGYGPDPYRVVRAAIALGAHYVDLADGARFVTGVAALDAEAKRAGVFALSGASSAPALTVAAVRRLAADMARVDEIVAGIAPSPRLVLGASVIRAMASCGGKPIALRRDGKACVGYGLLESRRVTVGPPGVTPLRPVRFSLVDVPDLALLTELWPEVRTVWFGAGARPEIVHRILNVSAWLVRRGVLPSLTPLAPLMGLATRATRWGEHRSGMFVHVAGRDAEGRACARSWHVVAHGDVGPDIPAMAAEAIVLRLLDGAAPRPGARAAIHDIAMADYEARFAGRAIVAGVRDEILAGDPEQPLYRRLLGPAWDDLPAPVRALHDLPAGGRKAAEGRATVERGESWLARLVARVMGFPQEGEDVPVRVDFTARGGRETWRRTFAGATFTSTQAPGRGRADKLLTERFGPLAFDMAVGAGEGRLTLVVRGWRAFGVPMPAALAPGGTAFEHAADGRFNFHVEIRAPLVGLIVAYRGWLEPAAISAAATVEPMRRSGVHRGPRPRSSAG